MITGRKPTPHALRVLEGNPQRRPMSEPDPSKDPLGTAARSLNRAEQSIWRKVRDECPWLKRADRFLVEAFARSWYQMVVADRKLVDLVIGATGDPEGAEGDTRLMTILQRMLDHARNSCLRMMAEMGMTATSRGRVLDRPHSKSLSSVRFKVLRHGRTSLWLAGFGFQAAGAADEQVLSGHRRGLLHNTHICRCLEAYSSRGAFFSELQSGQIQAACSSSSRRRFFISMMRQQL